MNWRTLEMLNAIDFLVHDGLLEREALLKSLEGFEPGPDEVNRKMIWRDIQAGW